MGFAYRAPVRILEFREARCSTIVNCATVAEHEELIAILPAIERYKIRPGAAFPLGLFSLKRRAPES
jgi:hypothetical protein